MDTKKIAMGIVAVAIVGLIAVNVMSRNKPLSTSQEEMTTTAQPTVMIDNGATMIPVDTAGNATAHSYKDGVYSAEGTYQSPAQQETVDVSITIKDNVVTDATFKGNGVNPTTKKMQGLFSQGFKAEVVGKNIDDVKLTVVNGSSLTPKGFNDALEKIKTEAAS